MFANTPEPPYFATIFTSQHSGDTRNYGAMADRMLELARSQPGFLGVESVRNPDGFGITVSYWKTEEAIAAWNANSEHGEAQQQGKDTWYVGYKVRITKVERAYTFR